MFSNLLPGRGGGRTPNNRPSNVAISGSSSSSASPNLVLILKPHALANLEVLRQSGELFLYERRTVPANDVARFELIYRPNKIYSFCRCNDYETICSRFDCLASIIERLPRGAFRPYAYQRVMRTIVEHPSWLDVHVAAYVSE